MQGLATLRCRNHAEREAAALCTVCRKPHCRECVTELGGRVLCSRCVARAGTKRARRLRLLGVAGGSGLLVVSVASAVLFFMLLGRLLLELPSEVHEGTIWTSEGDP